MYSVIYLKYVAIKSGITAFLCFTDGELEGLWRKGRAYRHDMDKPVDIGPSYIACKVQHAALNTHRGY